MSTSLEDTAIEVIAGRLDKPLGFGGGVGVRVLSQRGMFEALDRARVPPRGVATNL